MKVLFKRSYETKNATRYDEVVPDDEARKVYMKNLYLYDGALKFFGGKAPAFLAVEVVAGPEKKDA